MAAAATDAWTSAREGAVRLFARLGGHREDLAGEWLDEDAAAVEATSGAERERLRAALAPVWQVRLADLLAEFPEAAEELWAWAERTRAELPAAERSWAQSNIAGRDVYAVGRGSQVFYRGHPDD
ncbi:hypothetical protein I6A60_24520 [Frankia sp. AgB1.9]|uniref:hypothetical protein n=1 Tax=unclassified Frankia TaxID=2632575 RepID=UPI001934122A|nr:MULTISPECIES: hypothetical protein [unclassified Frankia]MBL7551005.1 hypothetical protein [Frankia sp. AgB1.9]